MNKLSEQNEANQKGNRQQREMIEQFDEIKMSIMALSQNVINKNPANRKQKPSLIQVDIEEESQGAMQQMPAIFRQKLKEKI